MRYLKYFFILLFIPFVVNAEECDISNITITSIEQSDINGNTLVVNEPTINGVNIGFDLKMYDVGDSITYYIEIKNDSEEDYMIDEDTFKTDSSYIEYSLKTNDNTNVVKAQSVKGVTLIVEYKKEVEDKLLSNNKYDASNTLKLSLSAEGKEKELNIITTSNIEDVKNPLTNTSSMMLISLVSLTTIIITCILIKRKNKYTKYIIIILSIVLVPTVYAMCQVDIEVDSKIEIEKIPRLYDMVANLAKEGNTCVTKYEGPVTDEVGKTVNATNVYFDNCIDQRNVIFGGFCWQVIRTTETGGTKMIYNGEPVDGKCESTRSDQIGFKSTNGFSYNINSRYLYGSDFTYDKISATYTLLDTSYNTWSDATANDLVGKYTCLSNDETCSHIFFVHSYSSNKGAYVSNYSIEPVRYDAIGVTDFNANKYSPAMVGYMYNKFYIAKPYPHNYYTESMFGSSFSYDENTHMYTLTGQTQNITVNNWRDKYASIKDTHYTCWNKTGTCETISYVHYTGIQAAHYYEMSNGLGIEDILNEMLYADDVNTHDSDIKKVIDKWYETNMENYTSKLENNVYCNNRKFSNYGSFNANGGVVTSNISLEFDTDSSTGDLACPNITDQFSISNEKAKLTYPVALMTKDEIVALNDISLFSNESGAFLLSPGYMDNREGNILVIPSSNLNHMCSINGNCGVKPMISLKGDNIISSGTGSESDPWIIE